MFIISLTYKKSTEEADKHMAAHMDWLKAAYAAGTFIASGRKVPRTGGVILARGARAEIEALCANDPSPSTASPIWTSWRSISPPQRKASTA